MRCLVLVVALLMVPLPVPACEVSAVWPAATERDASGQPLRRFIPPELYMGAPWDGSRELVLRPVDVTRRPLLPPDHPPIQFTGPFLWDQAPDVMMIKRTRFSRRNGKIDQVFRINERGDGLGRVADIRPDCARTSMNECFKFPLGLWQQGEVRRCRDSRITILEIDFEYHCVPHALKFDWNGEGVYVFSPDRGLVAIVHGVD